jgi:hypothetical protein
VWPPTELGSQVCTTMPCLLVEMRISLTFLPRLTSNYHPPSLCLMNTWDYMHAPPPHP